MSRMSYRFTDRSCLLAGSIYNASHMSRRIMLKTFERHVRDGIRRRRSRCKTRLTPAFERLERKLVPSSTYTWSGAGANNNWSTGANWQGGVSPTSGSTLTFGAGASRFTNVNDLIGLSV